MVTANLINPFLGSRGTVPAYSKASGVRVSPTRLAGWRLRGGAAERKVPLGLNLHRGLGVWTGTRSGGGSRNWLRVLLGALH